MPAETSGSPFTRAPELRSIANSIEPMFPDAADLLRGIAREMEPLSRPAATEGGSDA